MMSKTVTNTMWHNVKNEGLKVLFCVLEDKLLAPECEFFSRRKDKLQIRPIYKVKIDAAHNTI